MPGRETAVRSERLAAVYRQLPLTLGIVLLNASLTAAVLSPRVPARLLWPWLGATLLMVLARLFAWSRFIRLAPPGRMDGRIDKPLDAARAARWEWIAGGGALVSGLLWGTLGGVLMPAEQPYPLFVAFVVGGMCAGAATVGAAHMPSVVGFIVPAVLPLAVAFAMEGSRLSAVMALMMALFAGALVVAAARFSRFYAADVRVRTALAERTRELADANARLWAEMHEHGETEAALRHAQKMEAIGRLTAGVAHDFNNLLMAVSGSAEVLRQRLPQPLRDNAQLGAILEATERGGRLTRHLLGFARTRAPTPTVLDLNAAVRGVAALLGATLGQPIRIDLQLADAVWPVLADAEDAERALVNLAINARDAMPHGGTLTIATENVAPSAGAMLVDLPARAHVRLAVRDTGAGMTAAVLARAFDPFFTTKGAGEGSGLGLSQVYDFTTRAGGTPRIESAPGRGTTVTLLLPRAAAGAAVADLPAASGDDAATGRRGCIVLLDDDAPVREVLDELLRQAGHTVAAFARADDALARIAADPDVTLLVTDLDLPEIGGREAADRARRQRPGLPVLFVTGHAAAPALAGERWVLSKPFSEAALLTAIQRVLARGDAAPQAVGPPMRGERA